MKPKIIFFDIDGTLLIENSRIIPESTRKSIKIAQQKGNLVFINTGRPKISLDKFITDLNFDGYICGCGTYVEFKEEVLLSKSLGNHLSSLIVSKLREYKIDGILEGKDCLYYDQNENIKSKEVFNLKNYHLSEKLYTGLTWDDNNINFDKFTIFGDDNSNFDCFIKDFNNIFEFINRGKNFYEVVPKGYSKASGIKFIIDKLNIPIENTYAIGDSTNDLSMLQYVNNSIAMGNSTSILFDYVSFVTKDIDEDGVEFALKHYKII
ncbi:HAD family hydrolase [uncultured Clostridium sp.]|uniref:Cof-type HAD-IIB family hydrolase n=1 Tax=uncultured Clostridium sp. TaxID=59620 RepID=UPI0025EA8A69|nr:HAD family hydrolase [uncultured Clostridium sp.]